jgi:transcriptional regulator with XRE-family HTH domain
MSSVTLYLLGIKLNKLGGCFMGNSPIVNRINSLLAEQGIDKKKFYEDCGITSASYSLWNTGKTKPRMKNLEIIADYLHVPVSYLLEGKEQKENPAPDWDGLKEIDAIFDQLTPSRQAKLLELARLYLDDQRRNEETQ